MSINLWQLKTRAGSHVPNQWGPRMQGRPFTFRPKFPRVGGSDKIRAAASSTAAPAAASIAATTRATAASTAAPAATPIAAPTRATAASTAATTAAHTTAAAAATTAGMCDISPGDKRGNPQRCAMCLAQRHRGCNRRHANVPPCSNKLSVTQIRTSPCPLCSGAIKHMNLTPTMLQGARAAGLH